MGDSEEESKKKISEEFDIDSELSTLVEKKVIPSRIAEKLGQKLKEKNVKITKDQLNILVQKISAIMRTHSKFDSVEKSPTPQGTTPMTAIKPDQNMQKLVETIEKLESRLDTIEKGITTGDKKWDKTSPKVVTTDDLEVPAEWGVDPLKTIPSDPESIVVLMKWLQHLIDKCGRANLSNILDYYVDIGWITQDAKISLIDYSQGITEEGNKGQDPSSTKKIWDLPSRDHIQSLIYIQKLKGIQVDKHFIDRIDGELTRLTKKLDNYTFK